MSTCLHEEVAKGWSVYFGHENVLVIFYFPCWLEFSHSRNLNIFKLARIVGFKKTIFFFFAHISNKQYMELPSYGKKKLSFIPKRAPLGIIYVYSISEIKDSFVLGSKIILYLGELFFKTFNFLNMLQKNFRDGLQGYHYILLWFPNFSR